MRVTNVPTTPWVGCPFVVVACDDPLPRVLESHGIEDNVPWIRLFDNWHKANWETK